MKDPTHFDPFRRRGRLLVFAAVIVGAFSAFACKGEQGPDLPPSTGSGAPPLPSIPVVASEDRAPSTQSDGVGRVGTGTLYPRREAQLGPKVTGIISQLSVEEGDRVKKGQLLFRLDAVQAGLAVDQAKAALASAQVALSQAKTDFDRAAALNQRGSIAPATYDQAKARFDGAQTGVDQANVALQLAQKLAGDTAVHSPIDGVVVEKRMNVGETATMMPPSIVLVVQDVDELELRARLPETALKNLSEGSTIAARFPALDLKREVKIRLIKPTIDARTRTVEIVADVDNEDHKLKAGMLAEVSYGDETKAGSAAEPASSSVGSRSP